MRNYLYFCRLNQHIMYDNDPRAVITLDAGGTHFRFNAMRGNRFLLDTVELPSEAHNLDRCMANLATGFETVIDQLSAPPAAISFAFPGPADYPNGIFPTRLTNFPAFAEGVALGPFLERRFHLPVFINNDADLFAYGEALAGALPMVNRRLREAGGVKQYHNLIGFILGTGFGVGITSRQRLFIGDNCCSEVYCLPGKLEPDLIAEEGVSLRAILHYYNIYSKNDPKAGTYTDSYDIYRIAEGELTGDRQAALQAFSAFGSAAGHIIAHAAAMLDGILVLGGGVSNAHKLFIPALLAELRAIMHTRTGNPVPRVPSHVYNLEDEAEFEEFVKGNPREFPIYGSTETVRCDTGKRLGILTSQLGTSTATSIGAYCFALHQLDNPD